MSLKQKEAEAASTAPLSALLPHLIVAQHLQAHGFQDTLKAFGADAARVGITLPALHTGEEGDGVAPAPGQALVPVDLELPNLLSAYNEHQRALAAQAAALAASEALRERQLTDRARLLALSLPGPSNLPFSLHATFRTLHASNILSIAPVQLPVRRFSTTSARFEITLRSALATTAADRRVVIFDPESGEMIECLEGAQGSSQGHRAAVLSTAQNPVLPRELVSTSMDSSVLVWDLLAGGGTPIQVLKDHTRFVVHSAYSPDGRFLATAGYDRKILIYERKAFPQSRRRLASSDVTEDEEQDDDAEPVPLEAPFKLVHSLDTKGGNPEAIQFVSTNLLPLPEDDALGRPAAPAPTELAADRPRTWLAFSCRGECHINYLALPRVEPPARTSSGPAADTDVLTAHVDALNLTSSQNATTDTEEPADWTLVKCNTNENVDDWHVSYSLLSLALHPSGKFLSAQTGDHTRPSSTTMTGETIVAPPRILIVQPLRPGRVYTLFLPPAHSAAAALGGGTSLSPAPRHAWIQPKGEALWVAGEDGRVRLLDVKGEEGANARLRAEVWTQGRPDDSDVPEEGGATSRIRLRDAEQEASTMWSRGGNTVIKDICILDDEGSLATVGFDHTVRIVRRRKD